MRFKEGNVIAEGSGTKVHFCTRNGEAFARKRLSAEAKYEQILRFVQEVRILEKLNHPNIVRVVARHVKEQPYSYVMPYYDTSLAQTLPSLVGNKERINKTFSAILAAVEHAHTKGVIHRDLKPGNVLMNSDDDVVITDFGLGRMLDSKYARCTGTGAWMGTTFYMSPENWSNVKAADERCDVYSLGKMLYEFFGGRLTSPYPDLSRVPPSIKVIISRCTRYRPERRYQTVTELKQAWSAVSGGGRSVPASKEVNRLHAKRIVSKGTPKLKPFSFPDS